MYATFLASSSGVLASACLYGFSIFKTAASLEKTFSSGFSNPRSQLLISLVLTFNKLDSSF